jgi:hypothetical protein
MTRREGEALKKAMAAFYAAGNPPQHHLYRTVLNPLLKPKLGDGFYVDTRMKTNDRDTWNFRIYSTSGGRKLLHKFKINASDLSPTGKFSFVIYSVLRTRENFKTLPPPSSFVNLLLFILQ